jgi:pilus assembly protein CpaC
MQQIATYARQRFWVCMTGLCCGVWLLACASVAGFTKPAFANGKSVTAGPVATVRSGGSSNLIRNTSVVVRKSQVVDFNRPYATALMADSEVADVVPLSDHSIYILGKKTGTTRLTVVDDGQQVVQIIEVEVTPDIDDLRQKLAENLPEADLQVSAVSGGLVLSGTVLAAPDVARAMAIATRYAPVEAVTNAMMVASPQQVMLEVRFVEVSRSAGRELAFGTRTRSNSFAADTGGQVGEIIGGPLLAASLMSGTPPFGSMIARVLEGGTDVDIMLRALESKSLARRLAEPNLVTTSGDTASFLAGGEFPFPVSSSDNRISIEFKQFGVALAFTPTVLAGGLINLKIAPEVSDIDDTASIEVNNTRIPGLVVRRANTSVELRDGQSLAIAGLLQHSNQRSQAQLPWIGNVPVLGALFRSSDFQRSETDLVIIVTPRLVKPQRPGERLKSPIDDVALSNDPEFFLTGRAELTPRQQDRRNTRLYGHIINAGSRGDAYAVTK